MVENNGLTIVGKKPGSSTSARGHLTSNSEPTAKTRTNAEKKFVIKQPLSREITPSNTENKISTNSNAPFSDQKLVMNGKRRHTAENPYGYNLDNTKNTKSVIPQPKNSNKKHVSIDAERCAETTVQKGSCWKCYRLFDIKHALNLESVLNNEDKEIEEMKNSSNNKKWGKPKKKIFCSQSCLDDEVKRTCRVCMKCGKTFLRSEGKGFYCSNRCWPRAEEMAIEMNK